MKIVYICSPLRGDIQGNIMNARQYCRMAAAMGVVPLAPHTIFTSYLDDEIPEQREQGLHMGRELLLKCDELWFMGTVISQGMEAEIRLARQNGIPVYAVVDPENPLCYPAGSRREVEAILTMY